MKIVVTIVVLAAIVTIWLVTRSRAQVSTVTKTGPAKATPADSKEVYSGLRNTILQGSPAKLGLPATSKPTEPWGVVMDWGKEGGTATVVALSDGSASIYFSTGGGYIGGKGQEPIRVAAEKAVEIARDVQLPSLPTTTYPLPEQRGVFFYVLTEAGVFMFRTSEQELNSPSHPLRKVGDAMQGVVTQYRLWDEKRKSAEK
jgi:hypothetical protein